MTDLSKEDAKRAAKETELIIEESRRVIGISRLLFDEAFTRRAAEQLEQISSDTRNLVDASHALLDKTDHAEVEPAIRRINEK